MLPITSAELKSSHKSHKIATPLWLLCEYVVVWYRISLRCRRSCVETLLPDFKQGLAPRFSPLDQNAVGPVRYLEMRVFQLFFFNCSTVVAADRH